MSRLLSSSTTETLIEVRSRSWRIQLFTDLHLSGNYVVEFFRETIRYVNGVPGVPEQQAAPLRTTVAELAPQQVTLEDGTVLTGAQVAEAVALFGDKLEEQQS